MANLPPSDSHSLVVRVNQAPHSSNVGQYNHRYTSVSILFQTESEVVGRPLDPVAHQWSTATSLRSNFLMHRCGGYYLSSNPLAFDCRSPEQQRTWRENMGLFSLILTLMAGVGFLTFGFTEAVCPTTSFHSVPDPWDSVSSNIIHSYSCDLKPPATTGFDGDTNPITTSGWNLAGNGASFLFQKVNQHCLGVLTRASRPTITNEAIFFFRLVHALQHP